MVIPVQGRRVKTQKPQTVRHRETLTVFSLFPASLLPEGLDGLEDEFYEDEGRGQPGALVVLGNQTVHLPLPHVVRVVVNLLKHRPDKSRHTS